MKMNNDLFLDNINLVNKIVNKMSYGYIDKDDMKQAGLIGLYKATKHYNELINDNFNQYASIYIINEIKNELRTNKLIILNKNILKVKKYIKTNNISYKTIDDIALELNVSKDVVYYGIDYLNDISSLNEKVEDDELIDFVSETNNNYNDYNNLYYYVDQLETMCKDVIILKYYKNYTQAEIAKELNCSQSTVSRLEKNALKIIKSKIS